MRVYSGGEGRSVTSASIILTYWIPFGDKGYRVHRNEILLHINHSSLEFTHMCMNSSVTVQWASGCLGSVVNTTG